MLTLKADIIVALPVLLAFVLAFVLFNKNWNWLIIILEKKLQKCNEFITFASMREILITPECLKFIDSQDERVLSKFFQLVEVIEEIKVVHTNFVKKLINTRFYELRITAGNEIRVIIFAVDHLNFNECTKAICLTGFNKKSTKDYKKALKQAEKLLEKYI